MDGKLGKRFIRVAAVLFLLLLVAAGAGQKFKPGMAEEQREKAPLVNLEVSEVYGQKTEIPLQEVVDWELGMSEQDENDSQEDLPDLESPPLEAFEREFVSAGDIQEIEIYRDVLEEYAQAISEDANEVYVAGKWKYVYDVLYYIGKECGILYYSLENLSNHDNKELIMGTLSNGEYIPYIIYGDWGDGIVSLCIAERYEMTIYEGGIIELIGGGLSSPIMYEKLGEEVTAETLEMEVQDNGEITGYTRELYLDGHKSVTEEITEEEYLEIIERYTAVPVELKWGSLEGF